MRKVLSLFLVLVCVGCTSVHVPVYLPDKNPYTKRFYANHEEALIAITKALEDLGWEIEDTTDPSVYERNSTPDLDEKEILIFTRTRQTPMFLGSRYAKINVYVRSKKEISEIEIRYLTVTSLPFRSFESYQNNSAVQRIFGRIAELLSG